MGWNIILFAIVIFLILLVVLKSNENKRKLDVLIAESEIAKVLEGVVLFYDDLTEAEKADFVKRIQFFLTHINITAANKTILTEQDKILIASAGVIPIFRYPNWFYPNLNEIIVYPEVFSKDFKTEGEGRNIGGMVGDKALNGKMMLAIPALHSAYHRYTIEHTAIHEFAHLIDMADGALDGVPGSLLTQQNITGWKAMTTQAMDNLRINSSNINVQAIMHPSEFYAVFTEFYFQQPKVLAEQYPQIFKAFDFLYKNEQKTSIFDDN